MYGSELADQLAKAAARNRDTKFAFNRIPPSTLYSETEEAKEKLQKMERFTKAAVTTQFFPDVKDILKLQIDINQMFTALVTGHGKTRAYLHRFKVLEQVTCIRTCKKGDQTTDHLINQCTLLQPQRELLGSKILKSVNLAASKYGLITKHLKPLLTFTKSVVFDQL